jgi:hypothetical protein
MEYWSDGVMELQSFGALLKYFPVLHCSNTPVAQIS